MVLSLIAIVVNNSLIFLHVQTTTRRTNNTSFHNTMQSIQHRVEPATPMRRASSSFSATRSPRPSNRKVRAVAIQGAMYVATGVFCYLPTVMLRAIEAVQPDNLGGSPEGRLYILLVMQAVFLPSQNSIIMLIFIRPRYQKCRTSCPHRSRLWAFRYALFGGKVSADTRVLPSQHHPRASASRFLDPSSTRNSISRFLERTSMFFVHHEDDTQRTENEEERDESTTHRTLPRTAEDAAEDAAELAIVSEEYFFEDQS